MFNTLTYKTLEIPKNLANKVSVLLKNPDSDWGDYYIIKDQLIKNGVIIPNDYNDMDYLISRIEQEKNAPCYILTILPTYTCNFACWYCVQNHKNEYMSKQTVEAVKKHIERYLTENNIKVLEIHWFGGEPLLCFTNQVSEISKFAIDLCKRKEIKFINNITTNGYLIDEDIAKLMDEMCFRQFQITIDGPREIHDSTRNNNGKPSFDIILNNINTILKIIPKAQVFIRYNFTEENLIQIDRMISEINEFFDLPSRKKIMILAVKVWQEDKKNFDEICFNDIYTKFRNNGYSISNMELPNTYVKCDADLKHSRVIFHNGKVDKCNNILPDEAHSLLKDDGTIEELSKDCSAWDDILYKKPCCDCTFLPACLGPCLNIKRNMIYNSRCLKCAEVDYNWTIKERIKNYCLINSK